MYAIVDIAGQQIRVEKDRKIFVNRLDNKEGSQVEFDKVLLIDDNGKIKVGDPVVKGALVSAKVLDHLKGDKVKIFKKKRRKGYKLLRGHRQYLTQLLIEGIVAEGGVKKATAEKAKPAPVALAAEKASPAPEKKVAEPKVATATKTTAAKKTTTAKATTAKKTTATKATAAKKTTAAKSATAKKTTAAKSSTAKKATATKTTKKKEE